MIIIIFKKLKHFHFANRGADQSFSFTLSQYDLPIATFLLDSRKLYCQVTTHRAKQKEALEFLRVHNNTFSQTETALYELNREIISQKTGGEFHVDYAESLPKHS